MASAPQACVFVKDTEMRYVLCNSFHLVTYDLTREEDLIGKTARDYFPALLADAYAANDHLVFETLLPLWNEIWLVPHIRGTPRWFVSSKAPLFDLEGKLMGFFLNNTQSHVNLKLKGELSGVNFLVGDQFTKT